MAWATSSSSAEPTGAARGSSLRLRIALAVALLVLVAILAQAFAIFFLFEDKEDELIDDVVNGQLAHSMAMWRESPERAAPNTPDMRLFRVTRAEGDAALPAWLRGLTIGNHERHDGGNEYHVAVREDADARYVLTYDAEEHEARMRAIGSVIVVAALVIAAAVLAVVYQLAGRLTRQLGELAERVDAGREGGHARPGMAHEVAAVAGALDRYEQRQRDAVTREREFTANLSHELRTPLAVIRSDAELLAAPADLGGETAPAGVQRRAQRIVETVDRITELSTSLLTLAREARPQLEETLRLRELLQHASQALAARHGNGARLDLDVPDTATVSGDPALLRLVIDNLLDNALRHGQGDPIVCRLAGTRLEVRDHGRGFAPGEVERVFQRGWRGGRDGSADGVGHGLGLALVQHACRASGWQPGAANADGGGAVLSVDFGPALRAGS